MTKLSIKIRIKEMDKKIRTHFRFEKRKRVRKGIIPGNSSSLWKAVNIANDVGVGGVADRLHLRGVPIGDGLIPYTFADFYEAASTCHFDGNPSAGS